MTRDELVERLANRFRADRPCEGLLSACDECQSNDPNACKNLALSALSEIASAGLRIVPVEPTDEMGIKGQTEIHLRADCEYINHRAASYAWVAMLAAAPDYTTSGSK